MCIQYFAGLVAYIVAYSGLIDLVWSLYNSQSVYIYIAIGVTSIIVLPLSLLRNVTSLRFTSLMGFSCSVYLALVIMVEYFMLCGNGSVRDDVDHGTTCFWKINDGFYFSDQELFPLNTFQNFYQGFLTAFPLNIFAFTGVHTMYFFTLFLQNINLNVCYVCYCRPSVFTSIVCGIKTANHWQNAECVSKRNNHLFLYLLLCGSIWLSVVFG